LSDILDIISGTLVGSSVLGGLSIWLGFYLAKRSEKYKVKTTESNLSEITKTIGMIYPHIVEHMNYFPESEELIADYSQALQESDKKLIYIDDPFNPASTSQAPPDPIFFNLPEGIEMHFLSDRGIHVPFFNGLPIYDQGGKKEQSKPEDFYLHYPGETIIRNGITYI